MVTQWIKSFILRGSNRLRKRASVSVEATLVMWIVVMVLTMVLLLFLFVKKQIVVYQTMYEATQDAAVGSILKEDAMSALLVGDSYRIWGARLRKESVVYSVKKEGNGYQYSGFFALSFPFISKKIYELNAGQHLFVRSFDGYDRSNQDDKYVYITRTGSVYHSSTTCSHLRLNVREIFLNLVDSYRNENGGKYYPCSSCGKNSQGGIVYITTDGDRYHGNRDCKNLMRYIRKILLDEVKETHRPCKDCN